MTDKQPEALERNTGHMLMHMDYHFDAMRVVREALEKNA